MEDATETSYWCYMCSQLVNPVIEGEVIKCNFCEGGFVEEMGNTNNNAQDSVNNDHHQAADSLWAPMLIGMLNTRESEFNVEVDEDEDEEEDDDDDGDDDDEQNNDGEIDWDQQLEAIMSRRRSHSAAILDLLQGIRDGLSVQSETNEDNSDNRELVILINSVNQSVRIGDSDDLNSVPSVSLGDYFIGPGFELLLQRLAENDPNRYGTPPATKEAVEALTVVKIEESLLQCTVCLDDFEIGIDVKEMPCKHKFHSECLLPWLELHSSCPVCRYLLPTADDDDEPKTDTETSRNDDSNDDISTASMENNGSSVDSSSINSTGN